MKVKTRFSNILAVITAVLLMLSSVSVFANSYIVGDWEYERVPGDQEYYIKSYQGDAKELRIPALYETKPVTKISNNAFLNESEIKYIEVPATIKEIGMNAFYGCKELSEVKFNGDFQVLGANAFYGCTKLVTVNMNRVETLKTIPRDCFNSCLNIKNFTVPDGVESIEDRAFFGCISLKEITIPASVTQISAIAFMDCKDYTIYCYTDSIAHQFALENSISYVLLDGTEVPSVPDKTEPTPPTTTSPVEEVDPTSSEEVTIPSQGDTDPTEEPSQDVTTDPQEPTTYPDASTAVTENTIPSNPEVTAPEDDPFDTDPTEQPSSADKTEPSTDNNGKKKYLIGDTDLSGKITVKDATLIQKHAASLVVLDKIQLFLANVNNTGDVNVRDATQIQKYCAGFLNILFVGQEVEI